MRRMTMTIVLTLALIILGVSNMAGRKQFTTNLRTQPVDVTASRTLGIKYQNTFQVPILVQLAFNVDHQNVANVIDIIPSTGATSILLYNVNGLMYDANMLGAVGDVAGGLLFMVPAGWYYQIVEFSDLTSRIDWYRWVETQL